MINTSILTNITIDSNVIYYIYDYIPYNKRNYATLQEDKIMNHILNLKYDKDISHSDWEKNNKLRKEELQLEAMEYFYEDLVNNKIIKRDINMTICNVPASRTNKKSGIGILVERIVNNLNNARSTGKVIGLYQNGNKDLIRYKDIRSSHRGGIRSKAIHLDSIQLRDTSLFTNKKVLLVDDIITTGASMSACVEIIRKVNPQEIICLALAKTKQV